MCYITATEFKNNLGYYMDLSNKEDIFVTKNNKIITVLTNPQNKALQDFLELRHKLPKVDKDFDYDEAILKEIRRRCGF